MNNPFKGSLKIVSKRKDRIQRPVIIKLIFG
jgi:hypothetical protein